MMVDNPSSGGWFGAGFGLGLLAGGFIIYVIMKRRETVQTVNPVMMYIPQPVIQAAQQPAEVIPIPVKPVIESQKEAVTTYKNNEKWLIERDKSGVLSSLQIIRDAKING